MSSEGRTNETSRSRGKCERYILLSYCLKLSNWAIFEVWLFVSPAVNFEGILLSDIDDTEAEAWSKFGLF